MRRNYDEITSERRAWLGSDAESQRFVLQHVYGIAMQVMELREQHNLTQAIGSPRRWTPTSGLCHGCRDGSPPDFPSQKSHTELA